MPEVEIKDPGSKYRVAEWTKSTVGNDDAVKGSHEGSQIGPEHTIAREVAQIEASRRYLAHGGSF